jgi:hypothetical protein
MQPSPRLSAQAEPSVSMGSAGVGAGSQGPDIGVRPGIGIGTVRGLFAKEDAGAEDQMLS